MVDSRLKACHDRWYKLKDHPVQLELVKAVAQGIRFPIVPAGRRSGKTERFKRFIVKEAIRNPGMYFAAAPTYTQAKKIFWKDLKQLTYSITHPRKPSESELIIYLPNGSEIHTLGMDRPERIEGVPWAGGGIDEIADIKPAAWSENIYPALNTEDPSRADHLVWCWLLGVPAGLNHYYDMAMYAKNGNDSEWGFYTWFSSDILSKKAIESAKRVMDARTFREQYEGSFENVSGRIYEDYSSANHTQEIIQDHEQLLWHHDFNYTPLSSGIAVERDKKTYILDEIVLTSAVAEQSALEFCDKFKDHKNKNVIIYGDPSGRDGEKHGHESDYTQIEAVLRREGWVSKRRLKRKHPAIKERQNAVRARIKNALGEINLYVNPVKAVYVDKGLSRVQLKEGSTFLEEDSEFQHITTAVGYMIYYDYPAVSRETKQNYIPGLI